MMLRQPHAGLCRHPCSISPSSNQQLKISQHVNPRTASRVGQHLICRDSTSTSSTSLGHGHHAPPAAAAATTTTHSGGSLSHTIRQQHVESLGEAVPVAAVAAAESAVFDADAWNPAYNKSGLNGLTIGSTSGLSTVSGAAAADRTCWQANATLTLCGCPAPLMLGLLL